ncbi:membrane protein [hydrocarbon metagenome]|uniref:Membrane protein n=1 Tax=hydrocarbon metagenome TaxID=938273 RepID=A0A0W8E424_9ZZZZ
MNKRWISSLVTCAFLLASCVGSAAAALNQGNFIPCGTVQSVPTDSKMKVYSVNKGDTLWDISRKFKVDLDTLRMINDLNQNCILTVGQILEIPYNRSRVHIICAGDTLWDIAFKYDVSVNELSRVNPGINPNNLKIGEKVAVPDSTSVSVAAIQPSRSYIGSTSLMMAWPIMGSITSAFGWRTSGFHHGVDIAGDVGDPIKAAAAGKVAFVGNQAVYGKTVVIEHPDGKETVYAHCQKMLVNKNEYVVKGQTIATIGMTGRTTGPHVHFEVKTNGEAENPLKYLRY